jgi:hypothetical protein
MSLRLRLARFRSPFAGSATAKGAVHQARVVADAVDVIVAGVVVAGIIVASIVVSVIVVGVIAGGVVDSGAVVVIIVGEASQRDSDAEQPDRQSAEQ